MAGSAGIGFLIGFHELGHFIFCKLFKIRTPSFSIGFGPRLFERKIGDTVFALSAIPLGGYVEIAGAAEVGQGEQAEAHSNDQYSFAQKPYYQKMLVMAGGILFNLMFAYVTMIILFATGIPKSPLLYPKNGTTIIETIAPKSAAENAQLLPGDNIIAVNNQPINNNIEELLNIIEPLADTEATVTIERASETLHMPITFASRTVGSRKIGVFGVGFVLQDIPAVSFKDAFNEGVHTVNTLIKNTFFMFKSMCVKKNINGVGGPLMVISETIKGAAKGAKIFFLLLAFISVNLAVLNMLPLPIMDGGQALFYTIEAIIRRPLPENVRLYIHYVCWVAIVILAVYLSIKDIGTIATSLLAK